MGHYEMELEDKKIDVFRWDHHHEYPFDISEPAWMVKAVNDNKVYLKHNGFAVNMYIINKTGDCLVEIGDFITIDDDGELHVLTQNIMKNERYNLKIGNE
jgi:hypothetical protein